MIKKIVKNDKTSIKQHEIIQNFFLSGFEQFWKRVKKK